MTTKPRIQMIIVDKHIVMAVAKHRSKWWTLTCTCGPSRRRKDGSCKHVRDLLELVPPEIRARARIDPNQMGHR